MTRRTYRATVVEVSFDGDFSIHATECVRGLPAVFDRKRRPWVFADNATAEEVSAVIEHCPRGALQYRRLDGEPNEPTGPVTTVTAVEDGPLALRGDLVVRHEDGTHERLPRACAVPMRPVEEQAVLRQQPPRSRIPGARSNTRTGPVRPRTPCRPVIPT